MKNKVHKINGFVYVTSEELINNNDYITDGYLVWQWKDNSSLLGRNKVVLTNDTNLTTIQQLTQQEVEYLNTVDECEVSKMCYGALSGFSDAGYKLQLPKQETIEAMADEYSSQAIWKCGESWKDGYNHAVKTLYTAQQVTEYAYYFEKCYAERPMKKPLLPTDYFNQNKKK